MDRASEARLMAGLAQGDRTALRRLYDEHGPGLLRYLERILGDAGAAEDVCQEAFLRMWRKAEQFDPERGRFGAWLYRAASNLAFNRMALRSSKETTLEQPLRISEPEVRSPVRSAVRDERAALLRDALARLRERDRAILVLRHLEERSVAEVAEILEVPEGTVKSRLHYAMNRLATLLEPHRGDLAEEES